MIMLDILTIVHSFADIQTAARIRQTCRRLATLSTRSILYFLSEPGVRCAYRVGDKLHKLDGPAWESIAGSERWCREGIPHREYHPQHIIHMYHWEYRVKGVFHREVGPSVVYVNRGEWYMRGLLHRKIGPANTFNSRWYTLDRLHRLDGPVYGNIYAIRGVKHNITNAMDDEWIVNDVVIRP